MRLLLDIDAETHPISGWLERPCSARVAFTGLLELLAALERVLADDAAGDGTRQSG
jgi:hypothetical protein